MTASLPKERSSGKLRVKAPTQNQANWTLAPLPASCYCHWPVTQPLWASVFSPVNGDNNSARLIGLLRESNVLTHAKLSEECPAIVKSGQAFTWKSKGSRLNWTFVAPAFSLSFEPFEPKGLLRSPVPHFCTPSLSAHLYRPHVCGMCTPARGALLL